MFKTAKNRYLTILMFLFIIEWVFMAIEPFDRMDWLLENLLVFVALPFLWWLNKKFDINASSFTLIFLFLSMHEIGTHYTYALVPYKEWFLDILKIDLAEGRNHFDRLVHFSYGFLLTLPLREIIVKRWHLNGFLSYFLPVDLIMSTSMIYELIEWAVAIVFGGELGQAYLGTQGDIWDAHKDMALASSGAIIIMLGFSIFDIRKKVNK